MDKELYEKLLLEFIKKHGSDLTGSMLTDILKINHMLIGEIHD